jgi:dihydroorotase
MKPFDLVVAGGRIVSADSVVEADIAVSCGGIVAVGQGLAAEGAGDVIDATGHYVLPGAIDSHVHFREPGYTHKEDWSTGTAARQAMPPAHPRNLDKTMAAIVDAPRR